MSFLSEAAKAAAVAFEDAPEPQPVKRKRKAPVLSDAGRAKLSEIARRRWETDRNGIIMRRNIGRAQRYPNKFRDLRLALRLTQAEMCTELGLSIRSQPHLSSIENGCEPNERMRERYLEVAKRHGQDWTAKDGFPSYFEDE